MSEELDPVIQRVQTEQNQGHETRRGIIIELEKQLDRSLVSIFTKHVAINLSD